MFNGGKSAGSTGTVNNSRYGIAVQVMVAPVATVASAVQSIFKVSNVCSFCRRIKPNGSRILIAIGINISILNAAAVTADLALDFPEISVYSDSTTSLSK